MTKCSSCGRPIENFPDFLDKAVDVKCRECFGTAPKPSDGVVLPRLGRQRTEFEDEEEEAAA